ncbi:hypothetical protein GLU60_00735 [Nanohaloarchaea archaeon H01]|nr:hypothetical protein [Nanohaloarchaea archaeon H01]
MRTTLILLTFVVVASGCLHSSEPVQSPQQENPSNQTSSPTEIAENTTTIYFTGSGFQPADLTVQQGETVTWINNASRSMWVGSDQHPVHSEYSGSSLREHCQSGDQTSAAFDQCSTGDRFSFTFEKTGEWGYHNHQPFVAGGTITVTS